MNVIKHIFNLGYRVKNGVVYGICNGNIKSILIKNTYETFSVTFGSRKDNSRKSVPVNVHRLVAYQKYGDMLFDEGMEVRHKDGNSLNNIDSNIIIGTHVENMMDILPEKRIESAINASTKVRKFSDKTMNEIRHKRLLGAKYKELMEEYGISSKGTMSHIINNEYVTKT